MKLRSLILLILCVLLSGCGSSVSTLYGNNIKVTGDFHKVAYIEDYVIMDCCDEYLEIFQELERHEDKGLFEIYSVDYYDSNSQLVDSNITVDVEWVTYPAIFSMYDKDVYLYSYTSGELHLLEYTIENNKILFNIQINTPFIILCDNGSYEKPVCAVTYCDGGCKSCK